VAPNAVPGATRLTVRLTPSLVSSLVPSLEHLVGFPYGCTEQTMSRFLPTLLVQRMERQTGRSVLSNELRSQLPRMVRDGLLRLYRHQRPDGSWGFFEHSEPDAWMTAYVLYGLGVARPGRLRGQRRRAAKSPRRGRQTRRQRKNQPRRQALSCVRSRACPAATARPSPASAWPICCPAPPA
jgi:hypothetical protein